MRLWEDIREEMLRHPFQTFCEGSAQMTFEEVVIYSELFARKLAGAKSCAILCGSEMAAAIALLSCFASGVTAVPLSVRYGTVHCNRILEAISPDVVITDMDGQLQALQLSESEYTPPNKHPALIMCTSGTTGRPKGVMLSEKNLMANLTSIASYFHIGREDSILIARPLYHCAVLTGEFLISLVKGTQIRFYSEAFNPKALIDLMDQHAVTAFCSTPTLLNAMARFTKGGGGQSLRHIVVSGECMGKQTGKSLAQAFPEADIYHVYGLTEAGPRVSYLPPDQFSEHADSVGIPLKGVSLKILKPDATPAQTNEVGILWVRGDNVMLGYYNDRQQTDKVLRDGWLCTGDIALMDENGLLKIRGRKDDMIIRAGMNIYPQEVENDMKKDPRVREVMVYGIPDGPAGVRLGMDIAGDFSSIDEVKNLCARLLPAYQIPTHIRLVEALPKNGSGKIIRGKRHDGI